MIKILLHLQINLYQGGTVNNNNNNNKNNDIKQNLQLAKELHKPIIKKFKTIKVYSGFRDDIWGADLADMQLISNFNPSFTELSKNRFLEGIVRFFSYLE